MATKIFPRALGYVVKVAQHTALPCQQLDQQTLVPSALESLTPSALPCNQVVSLLHTCTCIFIQQVSMTPGDLTIL